MSSHESQPHDSASTTTPAVAVCSLGSLNVEESGTTDDIERGLDAITVGSRKIMIVDDEPVCIQALRLHLKAAGYRQFVTTEDSSSVLDLMREERPDILLLDLHMPVIGGFEVLEGLVGHRTLADTPVLVVTANEESEVRVRALKLGAADFLRKPVDPAELCARVRNLLIMKSRGDELRVLNESLSRRVEEQVEALRNAYSELQSLDRLKQEFLGLVSHELRTPLNGILGFLDPLLKGEIEDPEESMESLQIISDQAKRLASIVDEIQYSLSLTAGDVEVTRQPVELRGTLALSAARWQPRARVKGLDLHVEQGEPVEVSTDLALICDCLDRILDNAVKFTDEGGIWLRVHAGADEAVLEIEDSGRGVDRAYVDRVLASFSQGVAIENHSTGHGLGLWIVQQQLALMDARISFHSDGLGEGARVRVCLPRV